MEEPKTSASAPTGQSQAPAPATVPDTNGKAVETTAPITAGVSAQPPPTNTDTHAIPAPEVRQPSNGTEAPKQEDVVNGKSNGDTTASNPRTSPPTSIEIDKSMPDDFDGEVSTTNELPSPELVRKIENYIVLDRNGKTTKFKSLYCGPNVARRVLVIFVRHFFCGNCQEFLRTLSASITPKMLLQLPVSTFITIVGCGEPDLIDMYASETKCPFPIYTDPKRELFKALEMTSSWNSGSRPAYMKSNLAVTALHSVVGALKQIPKGKALKSGNFAQVGGEFLFEPVTIDTPISTPQYERPNDVGLDEKWDAKTGVAGDLEEKGRQPEEKRLTWCHRMKTTRDHAEIPELMEILGLDGQGQPTKNIKRWEKAVVERKGTGLSMASQMNQRNQEEVESSV